MLFFAENTLRKKWKYLRDQFCVELGKVQTSANSKSKWRHYKALDFLATTVNARFYGKGDEDDGNLVIDEDYTSDYFERLSPKVEVTKKRKSSNKTKKKSIKTKSTKTKIEDTRDNTSICNKYVVEEEDEHYLFFKSILPHMRKIPESKLLSFRGRVQCLVEEYAYGHDPTPTEFVLEIPIKSSPQRYSSEACDPIDTSD